MYAPVAVVRWVGKRHGPVDTLIVIVAPWHQDLLSFRMNVDKIANMRVSIQDRCDVPGFRLGEWRGSSIEFTFGALADHWLRKQTECSLIVPQEIEIPVDINT